MAPTTLILACFITNLAIEVYKSVDTLEWPNNGYVSSFRIAGVLIMEPGMEDNGIREMLNGLIADADLTVKPAYSVGEVARILNISQNTVRKICDAWEADGDNAGALRCYRFGAKRERRIPRSNLATWLARNDGYEVASR